MIEREQAGVPGIWVPLVTPFTSLGAPDLPALERLVKRLRGQGVAGFVACGSTGEAAMLSADEQQQVLHSTLTAAGGLPVLMGLQGMDPHRLAERAAQLATQHRPAGWLLAPPPYVKPSQAAIVQWFHAFADATELPVVAYDIPSRTGVRIEPASLMALADHPRIRALKDCSGDRAAAETVLADGRLALLAGNDDELFDQLARGAAGGIVASAHLATPHFVQLARCIQAGELVQARALWRGLAPLARALFAEPNPAPLKGALAWQGAIDPRLRPPLLPAGSATLQGVRACLDRLGAPPEVRPAGPVAPAWLSPR